MAGHRGKVGAAVVPELRRRGHEVAGFDRRDGQDVRDRRQLNAAVSGCEAVVHLAAMPSNKGPAARLLEVNVIGTWNVLSAAAEAGVSRFVFMSSVNALGVFSGEGTPDYLPIDDAHPARPKSAYGLSKLLGEELCRRFSETDGLTSVCLRPPFVADAADYERLLDPRRNPAGVKAWEYGAFLDARDLATATAQALERPAQGHVTLLLCADDVSTRDATSRELAAARLPSVEWRGVEFEADAYRALVDAGRAREVLDWAPVYTWQRFLETRPSRRSPAGLLALARRLPAYLRRRAYALRSPD